MNLEWMMRILMTVVIGGSLASCGGAVSDLGIRLRIDDSGPDTITGYFKDSNVSGLAYQAGSLPPGVTSPAGVYEYELGQQITFSVGGVKLGSSISRVVLTPLDLVPSGNIEDPAILNIARFLMMLDNNSTPDDGIVISGAVQEIAENWQQVDFTTADLAAALTGILSDVASVDGRVPVLPAADAASAHLSSTLRCIYSGAYRGQLGGDATGRFGFYVDADGAMNGAIVVGTDSDTLHPLTSTSPINFNQRAPVIIGSAGIGAEYQLTTRISTVNVVEGDWVNTQASQTGALGGGRIGGTLTPVYRFAAEYSSNAGGGDDYGVVILDVSENNSVEGVWYSVRDDLVGDLRGTLAGDTGVELTVGGSNYQFIGFMNTTTGELTGTWTFSTGGIGVERFGDLNGSGCRLN
jgi:hypothetical protein